MFEFFLRDRIAEGLADKPAIVSCDRSWTYGQVEAMACAYGASLRRLGVQPEQRVIVALCDGPDYAAALFGILAVGAVVVMVNPDLGDDELRYLCAYSRARVLIVQSEQRARFEAIADALRDEAVPELTPQVLSVLPLSQQQPDARAGGLDVSGGSDILGSDFRPFAVHPDDPAIWLFSGGTTGRPKAVVQSHRSFIYTTKCYGHGTLGITPEDITLAVPKLYFGYATGAALLFPFSVGATTILDPERCTAARLFELIRRHRPTILIGVPTMLLKMLEHDGAAQADLSSLRFATSAGEALSEALFHRFEQRFGVEVLDGLGTAEMWHIFISNRPGDVRPGTLGRVVDGFQVRVCDDDGNEVPRGEVGWLWVRGGARALGYFQQQDKTAQAFRGEWYISGDMIRCDADGYFTYCGRGDDMLKVSGKWLSPKEVEDCLREHAAVRDCAVVGIVDGHGLTKPHAFVVAEKASASLEQVLLEHVRSHLQPYKAPRRVHFLESLPQTHLGKVDRGKLRTLVTAGPTP